MLNQPIALQKRHYLYENTPQFFALHQSDPLASDRKLVFYAIRNLILDLAKNGITYYPKFYQFLNKEVHLNHMQIRELAHEIDSYYLKIFFQAKTKKNMNGSDINAIISYAALYRSQDVYNHIMYFIHKNKKDCNLFTERLKELIESVLDQKNSNHPQIEDRLYENNRNDNYIYDNYIYENGQNENISHVNMYQTTSSDLTDDSPDDQPENIEKRDFYSVYLNDKCDLPKRKDKVIVRRIFNPQY